MGKIRVFHLIHHLNVGGAEVLLTELMPALAALGFDVSVGCLTEGGPLCEKLRQRNVPVLLLNKKRGFDPGAVLNLARLLRELDVQVLNTHEYSAYLWGGVAAALANTSVLVSTIHSVAGWHTPAKQSIISRMLRSRTERYIAVSDAVKASLNREQGIAESDVTVIWNGVDPVKFTESKGDPGALRSKHGIPQDIPVVGMIGRCSPEKGGEDFIAATAQLVDRGERLHAVLVGDGPERSDWENLAARLGIEGHITFVGTDLDVPRWMQVFTLVVCPSREESFGITAIEAQAASVPVVATRAGGVPEVLGDSAILVPTHDRHALADAIASVLGDPRRRQNLIRAGLANVNGSFTIEQTARRYADLYRRCAGRFQTASLSCS